jgi:hypothetical protein
VDANDCVHRRAPDDYNTAERSDDNPFEYAEAAPRIVHSFAAILSFPNQKTNDEREECYQDRNQPNQPKLRIAFGHRALPIEQF